MREKASYRVCDEQLVILISRKKEGFKAGDLLCVCCYIKIKREQKSPNEG